jgi:hypothetical protein
MVIVMMIRMRIDDAGAKGSGYDKADDDEFDDVERFHYSSI